VIPWLLLVAATVVAALLTHRRVRTLEKRCAKLIDQVGSLQRELKGLEDRVAAHEGHSTRSD
jgi:hypothetical protein